MTLQTYCKSILSYKDSPMTLCRYFGMKYIIMKALILLFAGYLLYNYSYSKPFGLLSGILIGYVIGIVLADFRRALMAIKTFELQKQVIDWQKVEDQAKKA